MKLTTFANQLKSTILEIKSIKKGLISENDNIGMFYAIEDNNKGRIGYHFVNKTKEGDTGNYDHGCVAKNQDLVYFSVLKINDIDNVDIDKSFIIAKNHSIKIKLSRDAIKNSSLLNKLGFDLDVSEENKTITLILKKTSKKIIILQNKFAEDFINNALQFSIYCNNRFSTETSYRAGMFHLVNSEDFSKKIEKV